MKLPKKFEKILYGILALALVVFCGCLIKLYAVNTFAEGEDEIYDTAVARFVTFYDGGERLTVKTDAPTVEEALKRADILINTGDIIEPGLETEINADNFFINIYRAHPVVVKEGVVEKYLMTASYDYQTIMTEAGVTVYDGDEIKMVPNENFL